MFGSNFDLGFLGSFIPNEVMQAADGIAKEAGQRLKDAEARLINVERLNIEIALAIGVYDKDYVKRLELELSRYRIDRDRLQDFISRANIASDNGAPIVHPDKLRLMNEQLSLMDNLAQVITARLVLERE